MVAFSSKSQTGDSTEGLKYELYLIDSTMLHCGYKNEFGVSDSTVVTACIFFPGLSATFDSVAIFKKAFEIMNANTLHRAKIFRAKEFDLPIVQAYEYHKIIKGEGISNHFIGEISHYFDDSIFTKSTDIFDYNCIEYEFFRPDTMYSNSEDGSVFRDPDYGPWDELKISSNIIYPVLPEEYDSIALHQITTQIMKANQLYHVTIWRIEETIPYMRFSYMPDDIRKKWLRDYVGSIRGQSGTLNTR